MKRCIILLLCLLSSFPAMADVIYRWHTVSASDQLPGFDATVRISDAAFQRGSAYLDYTGCAGIPGCASLASNDDDGILYVGFTFAMGSDGHHPPLGQGVYDRFNLSFDRFGGMSGSFSYNSSAVEFDMKMGPSLWSVDLLRGDPFMGSECGGPTFCSGTTGYFQADSLPVPEPGAGWLMLAGVAALALLRGAGKRPG